MKPITYGFFIFLFVVENVSPQLIPHNIRLPDMGFEFPVPGEEHHRFKTKFEFGSHFGDVGSDHYSNIDSQSGVHESVGSEDPSFHRKVEQKHEKHIITFKGTNSDPSIDDIFNGEHGDEDQNFQSDHWKTINRGRSPSFNFHEGVKGRKGFSSGGCARLSAPMNSALSCIADSGCQATCRRGYVFPGGRTDAFFICRDGKWLVKGDLFDITSQCSPSCIPPCQNDGICSSPNTCTCLGNYFGGYCQYERKPCKGLPQAPKNANGTCSTESCSISCLRGYQFPDGSSIANIFCKDGRWTPGRPDWESIPDCQPICDPPCRNGGICFTNNLCQCPLKYKGPQCQYSVDACDHRKLNFNGDVECFSDDLTYQCKVSCPIGMSFFSAPASFYSCSYSNGIFSPDNVPKCVFDRTITEKHVREPASGSCFIWSGTHYKTFDGRIISFKSNCLYTLVSDKVDNLFHIQMMNRGPNCYGKDCSPIIHIYIGDTEYKLQNNDVGQPILRTGSHVFSVPTKLSGLRVDLSSNDRSVIATISSAKIAIKWNLKDKVEINISEESWNGTAGVCGLMDGDATNDLSDYHESIIEYTNKWKVNTLGETCNDDANFEYSCENIKSDLDAHEFCNKIIEDSSFDACRKVTNAVSYYEACLWDFCTCNDTDRTTCACESLSMFVHECTSKGVIGIRSWRNDNICPMKCEGGKIYMPCGPISEQTCSSPESASVNKIASGSASEQCNEGCFCPPGTFADGSRCVARKDCPCLMRGKSFRRRETVPVDCNTCTCMDGKWSCTEIKCLSRCEAIGDPHYTTFDGRHFNFMGKCSYYLVKGDNYSIEAENIACEGKISEALGFSGSTSGLPSCTKNVFIRLNKGDGKEFLVALKQNRQVFINGEEQDVSHQSLLIDDLLIRQASSLFIQVELPNGMVVWWDGDTRVYVDAPPSFYGKTKGLCGTFNSNQNDDFLTPEGDIEQDVVSFANKWRTRESCDNIETSVEPDPCEVNVQNKAIAEAHCSNITGQLFFDCRFLVDPMPYYQSCLYDMCACKSSTKDCLCTVIAAYAKQCSHQGVNIEWRSQIRKCGLQCPAGQLYDICSDSCERTCQDISINSEKRCVKQCVEGCNCPPGRTLNKYGECIPVSQCHCMRNGMEYPPGHKDIQPGRKGLQLCECRNAVWECRLANKKEIEKYPNESMEIVNACSVVHHQVFTHCLPPEPLTCKNMHNRPQYSSAICHSGCVCKKGYVLDSISKDCVLPEECPCHHGGKSYSNGEQIQESCNTCTCVSGKWNCSDHTCPGVCSTWGDSHFKTFDNKIYDFNGACDYILAKGMISEDEFFKITIELVPCGSTGVSCSKSVTLSISSSKGEDELVTFTSGKSVPLTPNSNNKRIITREAGIFTFAEIVDLGIVVEWDKGTRVSVRVDPKWKERLDGLCGNYNDNESDDFKTPFGVSEVSPQLFGDTWKVYPYCPEGTLVKDACALNPKRRTWSLEKCSILKSSLFRPCHSEVPVDPYIERCVFDTCACDQGGDCECLCTAIAAYSQECNARGVPIQWRSQQLCPIQCDESCSEYKPCIEACPVETCDNLLVYKSLTQMCQQDVCVEGCQPKKCPPGEVYNSTIDMRCVPVALCKPVCLEEDGLIYYEGDVMEGDSCQSCFCSRHQKICLGEPCSSTTVIEMSSEEIALTSEPSNAVETTVMPNESEYEDCVHGWTVWLNRHHPVVDSDEQDIEEVPTLSELQNYPHNSTMKTGKCSTNHTTKIRCRDADTHVDYKDTREDVICSLEDGLQCYPPRGDLDRDLGACNDYEISVFCDCGTETASTTVPSTTAERRKVTTAEPKTTESVVFTTGSFEHLKESVTTPIMIPSEISTVESKQTTVPACADEWSDWINITNPQRDGGDFELLSVISHEGFQLCKTGLFVTDIQCQYKQMTVYPEKSIKDAKPKGRKATKTNVEYLQPFNVHWYDYKKSPDIDVICDPNVGLECINAKQMDNGNNGVCHDYRIRVLCSCEKPIATQTTSTVIQTKTYTDVMGQPPTTTPKCQSDETFWDCKIHCDQLCLYYEHILHETGKCNDSSVCISGCVSLDRNSLSHCPIGFMWRDSNTCVRVDDCTCRSHSGQIVKPGEIIHESDCEICQCLNNQYKCDRTNCVSTAATSSAVHSSTSATTVGRTTSVPSSTTAESVSSTMKASTYAFSSTTSEIITVPPPTVTPPAPCDENRFIPLLEDLSDESFTASSSLPGHKPSSASMSDNMVDFNGWKPLFDDKMQFLQVDLGKVKGVYGIKTQGDVIHDEMVTSYRVMYSDDGIKFSNIEEIGNPKIFRGNPASFKPWQEIFDTPIEARFIRIYPNTWKNGITLNIELIGCGPEIVSTTTTTRPTSTLTTVTTVPTTTAKALPVCTDRMGLDNNLLQDGQVTVSSSVNGNNFSGRNAALSSPDGWSPIQSSSHHWIQFDWLGERNITGVITKGGFKSNETKGWVTAYKVAYSHDGVEWNFVYNKDSKYKIFMGNFDSDTPQTNYFDLPIRAQYIRIYPYKWEFDLILRIEVLGCFIPYPTLPPVVRIFSPSPCSVCPGISVIEPCPCPEESGKYWDGEQCSFRNQCPCIVGHLTYAVGAVYETEDCEKCVCALDGIRDCKKKNCPDCPEGMKSSISSTCSCSCQPCPPNTRFCKGSNICIDLTKWCDGVVDCSNDETNCTFTTTARPQPSPTTVATTLQTIPTTTRPDKSKCPPIECPDGFVIEIIKPMKIIEVEEEKRPVEDFGEPWSPFGGQSKWNDHIRKRFQKGVKGGRKGVKSTKGSFNNRNYKTVNSSVKREQKIICPEFKCNINKTEEVFCITPKCSEGYDLVTLQTKKGDCPEHKCVLKKVPDGNCIVSGRTFHTFDGNEFKYDICNHTLAQDRLTNSWQIKLMKSCTYIEGCDKYLVIYQFNNVIEFHTNMTIRYNGYNFSVPQMEKIGSDTRTFAIKEISKNYIIFSSMLKFTVTWSSNGDVKVFVPGTSHGIVNGLCGLFDGKPETDRQKPDGSIADTNADFAASWGTTTEECETVCPKHIQDAAWKMCSVVRKSPLSECESVVNVNRFLTQCVESLCSCLESNANNSSEITEKCRCDALLSLVTECHRNKPSINIASWRHVNNCPVECPSPLIYKECYNRIGEFTCANLLDDDPCPISTESCFPGCYCPDGLLRDGNDCIKPTDCRDCVCENTGKTRYISFDKIEYVFNSNCTYVLTETVPEFDGVPFKILVSTGLCDNSAETCVKSVTLIYDDIHTIEIFSRDVANNEIFMKYEGDIIADEFPFKTTWFEAVMDSNKQLVIKLLAAHLELIFNGRDKGLLVQVPSQIYKNKTQGLCGNCYHSDVDGFRMSNGTITDDIIAFGQSWLAKNVTNVNGKEENCQHESKETNVCEPPPPDKDECLKLFDKLFEKCHIVVNPEPFIENCHEGLCNGDKSVCDDLESYARECQKNSICVPWRAHHLSCPFNCSDGLEYKACTSGCPETCDNYEKLRKSPDMCQVPPGEGCVCPVGKVLLNGTCVPELRCQPCDSEGHFPGDKWHPDPCTTCSCVASNTVQCQRVKCPGLNDLCQLGHKSVMLKGTEKDCCPQFICVPEPCKEPQQPFCGDGQILKKDVDKNGCQQLICVCKPKELCDDISKELNKVREPGITAFVNDNGCCPVVDEKCEKSSCPVPPKCSTFFELSRKDSNKCCPDYVCEPPKDKCLYEFEYTNDPNGGTRKLKPFEKYLETKKPGETWQDGPCLDCECQESDLKAKCRTKSCPAAPIDNDYIFETINKFGECCPSYNKTACKVGDKVYKVGEHWPSPDGDKCKNFVCKLLPENGEIYSQEIVETCNKECKPGSVYVKSNDNSRCCGECKYLGCFVNGVVKLPGTEWFEDNDNCTTYSCSIDNGEPQLVKSRPSCPKLDSKCQPENIHDDGCCKTCVIPIHDLIKPKCLPQRMKEESTVRLVSIISSKHGSCENIVPIANATDCRGSCDSYTVYNKYTKKHDSNCSCCQVVRLTDITVPLVCIDGSTIEQVFAVPSECKCGAGCGGSSSSPPRKH